MFLTMPLLCYHQLSALTLLSGWKYCVMRLTAALTAGGVGAGAGGGLGTALPRLGNFDFGLAAIFSLTQSLRPTLKFSSLVSHLNWMGSMFVKVNTLYTKPSFAIDKKWFSDWTPPDS